MGPRGERAASPGLVVPRRPRALVVAPVPRPAGARRMKTSASPVATAYEAVSSALDPIRTSPASCAAMVTRRGTQEPEHDSGASWVELHDARGNSTLGRLGDLQRPGAGRGDVEIEPARTGHVVHGRIRVPLLAH